MQAPADVESGTESELSGLLADRRGSRKRLLLSRRFIKPTYNTERRTHGERTANVVTHTKRRTNWAPRALNSAGGR
jgi:hypothetical protein